MLGLLRGKLWFVLAVLLDFPSVSAPQIGTFLVPCAKGRSFTASLVKGPGGGGAQPGATGSSGVWGPPPLHEQGVATPGL